MAKRYTHARCKRTGLLSTALCLAVVLPVPIAGAGMLATAPLLTPPSQNESGATGSDRRPAGDTARSRMHDYLLACSGCHGFDGNGSRSGDIPPLAGLRQRLMTEAGRDYVIRLPGTVDAPLTDIRLAALLNWVAARFSTGSPRRLLHGQAVTPEEVSIARSRPLQDPVAVRMGLTRDPT